MDCLIKLVARLKDDGADFEVKILSGTLVYAARDKLAHHAIDNRFTHVLWLDADMIFNDDLLEDLMFSGKNFVTAICHARRKPYVPCFFKCSIRWNGLKNIRRASLRSPVAAWPVV